MEQVKLRKRREGSEKMKERDRGREGRAGVWEAKEKTKKEENGEKKREKAARKYMKSLKGEDREKICMENGGGMVEEWWREHGRRDGGKMEEGT